MTGSKIYTVAWKRQDNKIVKLQVHPHLDDRKLKFDLDEAIKTAKEIHDERKCETRVYKGWEVIKVFE